MQKEERILKICLPYRNSDSNVSTDGEPRASVRGKLLRTTAVQGAGAETAVLHIGDLNNEQFLQAIVRWCL